MSEPEVIDIWGDEGGMQLVLHRLPNGHVVVGIDAVGGSERRRLGEVTIARFRLPRIAQFLVPEEDDSVRCKSMRGPRSKIRCEVYEGHNDAHCGRGKSGRWFWW